MHGGYVLGIVVVGVAGPCIQEVLDIGAGDWRGLVVISSGENPEPSILVVFFPASRSPRVLSHGVSCVVFDVVCP